MTDTECLTMYKNVTSRNRRYINEIIKLVGWNVTSLMLSKVVNQKRYPVAKL